MASRSTACPSANWIDFLRQYGPIPRNDNMYDEAIQWALQRKKITPLTFEAIYLEELLINFHSSEPKSVILTGTAGDGKTYYCREIWERLGGSKSDWEANDKINSLTLNGIRLTIIKDLSEWIAPEKSSLLPVIATAILGQDPTQVYLIAANDGQLLEAWTKAAGPEVQQVRAAIEDLLVKEQREQAGFDLRLYNLSRRGTAETFTRILDAVLQHPGWQGCQNCTYQAQGCPIWENKLRLEGTEGNRTTRLRLTQLLELCDLNEIHLPVRQLLLLIANALLGHPHPNDKLLSCKQVPKLIGSEPLSAASLYRNIFGENLSERNRETRAIFKALRRFGIGQETSNPIDNILIYGGEDPAFQPYYQTLVLADPLYGADKSYQEQQQTYLEGDTEHRAEFLIALQSQRQRLFFTLPDQDSTELKLWDLTVFHYAGEYLSQVYQVLQQKQRVSRTITVRLVRGLNRIFTGLLVNNQEELILATSGSFSQARISRVYEEFISVVKKRGESIAIELDPNRQKLQLAVYLSAVLDPVSFDLTLTRYEYLSRVAEGVLPSSFSQECYEDVLAFKTQILKQLTHRKESEDVDEDGQTQMNVSLLEINGQGIATPRSLEVTI
jgi:hypothetical protein